MVTVNGQAGAGGHLVGVGHLYHERAEAPHLLLEKADRRLERGVAERVGAHELAETVGVVRLGAAHRAHLVEVDGHTLARELPRRLRTGEAPAHDGDALAHVELARRRAAVRRAPLPAV